MRLRQSARIFSAATIGGVAFIACTAQSGRTGAIALDLVVPKGILDNADAVTLTVYDASAVGCAPNGQLNGPAPSDPTMVLTSPPLALGPGCGGKQWCVEGQLTLDPTRNLTWYIAGTKGGGPAFYGCTQHAMDADPVQLTIKVLPYVPGSKCGDGNIIPPKTCDPAGGATTEACDATTCTTSEVIVSNGAPTNFFFKGNPGRKTAVRGDWIGDSFIALWSDGAVGPSGGDGQAEVTTRKLTTDLVSLTKPLALTAEVRLPRNTNGASSDGNKVRSGVATAPAMAATGDTAGTGFTFWVVFAQSPSGLPADSRIMFTPQDTRLIAPGVDDAPVVPAATVQQDQPDIAINAGKDALVVWRTPTGIHCALRKHAGTSFGTDTGISTGTSDANPRVAAVGSDFIVTWGDGNDIQMQRVGPDGLPKGSVTLVNTGARQPGVQDTPVVAGFPTGEFAIAWHDKATDAGDIRVQKFDKNGNAIGTESSAPANDQHTSGEQSAPTLAAGLAKGGQRYYLLAWADPADQQVSARFLGVDSSGFLQSTVDPKGSSSEFFLAKVAGAKSGPAAVIDGSSPNYCAVLWVDDAAGTAASADDRVRVRRLPGPYIP